MWYESSSIVFTTEAPPPPCSVELMMDDLDSYLESELASINEVFQQFESKDRKAEEEEEHRSAEQKATHEVCIYPSYTAAQHTHSGNR